MITGKEDRNGVKYRVGPHCSGWDDGATGRIVEVERLSGDGLDAWTWCGWCVPVDRLVPVQNGTLA